MSVLVSLYSFKSIFQPVDVDICKQLEDTFALFFSHCPIFRLFHLISLSLKWNKRLYHFKKKIGTGLLETGMIKR